MFGWEFPPHISGGLGTACCGLCKGLVHNGVEVLFVVPKVFGDEETGAVKLINAGNISTDIYSIGQYEWLNKMTLLAVSSQIVPYLSPSEFAHEHSSFNKNANKVVNYSSGKINFEFSGQYGNNLMNEVMQYAMVAGEIARTNQFDVIHAHDWLTYPAGIVASEVSGKPLVVHMHATEFDRSGEHINHDIYDVERIGMETAHRVIAVSKLTKHIIMEKYGISSDKINVLHNAVMDNPNATASYDKKIKEKIVTFLGRVTFQKGPDYFIEAAKKVIDKDENVRFVMAGSGDMLYRMIKRAAELRIASKIHFTGFLRGDDVTRMLAMSDVYVMPSVSEPFGISALEALQSKVPIIISKQSGVSEVLKHAVKIDFWDVDAMADAIYSLLHHSSFAKLSAHMGYKEMGNLKWERQAYKLNKIYESVLNNKNKNI